MIIEEKFLTDNLQDYQTIGGDRAVVLLDCRQNEELRIKGFAREIINRIQKLKKKAGLKAEDEVFIFHNFDAASENLNKAIQTQSETIRNAVKKPIFSATKKSSFIDIARDSG